MLNKVQIIGYLGRDPETRSTPSGQTVATISVATSERWKDRDGNQQERTEWHSVTAWGRLAEICAQYLHKGKLVYFEGKLQTRSWEDQATGERRYKTEIVASEMKMLGRGGGDEREDGGDQRYGQNHGYSGGNSRGGGYSRGNSGGGGRGGYSRGGGQGSGDNFEPPAEGYSRPSPTAAPPADYGPDPTDDDIPF